MRSCKSLKGGLQDVADDLQVSRIGQQHQAGSDSLLTASTFFKLREKYFDGKIEDRKYLGCLYGFTHSNGGVVRYTRASNESPGSKAISEAISDTSVANHPEQTAAGRLFSGMSKQVGFSGSAAGSGASTPAANNSKNVFGNTPIGSAGI